MFVNERLTHIEMEALLIALTLYVVGDNDKAIDQIAEMSEVIATRMEEESNAKGNGENGTQEVAD